MVNSKPEKDFVSFKYVCRPNGQVKTLFIKRHDGDCEVKPASRTLYVVNIPQYLNEECIEELFKPFGTIEKIFLQLKPSSGLLLEEFENKFQKVPKLGPKVCFIVFNRPVSVKKALKIDDKGTLLKDSLLRAGKKQWMRNYNSHFIDSKDILTKVEMFMGEYDEKVEEEKQKDKEIEGVPDEDGWVSVTKHSKKQKIPRSEKTNKRLVEKQKRAQAKQTLVNFYKCQLKNAKLDEIAELRKKFENDKKRLALMKVGRKFKPF